MILLLIIVGHYFPPKIAIMTGGHQTVPWIVKVPGGIKRALTQTSMACTSMERTVIEE